MLTAVGIDLSLTGLGLCAVPGDWDPSSRAGWERIRRTTLSTPAGGPLVARADALAVRVVEWIGELGVARDDLRLCHEGYPIGGRVYNLDKLCELGGIVKRALWLALRIDPWAAPQSAARKLICGKLPQRDRKAVTIATLRALAQGGLDDATPDECDAIVVANLLLKENGRPFVATPEPPKVKRPSKRSRTQVTQLELGRRTA